MPGKLSCPKMSRGKCVESVRETFEREKLVVKRASHHSRPRGRVWQRVRAGTGHTLTEVMPVRLRPPLSCWLPCLRVGEEERAEGTGEQQLAFATSNEVDQFGAKNDPSSLNLSKRKVQLLRSKYSLT